MATCEICGKEGPVVPFIKMVKGAMRTFMACRECVEKLT